MARILTRDRWMTALLSLAAALGGICFLASLQGAETISPMDAVRWMGKWMMGRGTDRPDVLEGILIQIRIPRIILAVLAGAALAVVGTVLQSLFRNPLADPYLLGVSGGAALGTTLALFLGPTVSWMTAVFPPAAAFIGGLTTLLLVYRLSMVNGDLSVHALLLTGIAVNAVVSSLILLMMAFADPVRISRIVFWLMGNLHSPEYSHLLAMTVYILIGFGLILVYGREFNLMTLGQEAAHSLGVDVGRLKRIAFTASALLTGSVVAVTGPIGFVGILVPHILRFWFGCDHRLLLPASALGGGIFLVAADTLARTVSIPAEIPVGVVTALCGGPLFIYLLKRRGATS